MTIKPVKKKYEGMPKNVNYLLGNLLRNDRCGNVIWGEILVLNIVGLLNKK